MHLKQDLPKSKSAQIDCGSVKKHKFFHYLQAWLGTNGGDSKKLK